MSKSTAWQQGLLDLVFLNTDFANVGDAGGLRGSVAAGSLYVALHTADPGEGGAQNTSECTYTGYARVAVARSGAGFARTGSEINPVGAVTFGQRSDAGATQTATWFSIGTASSGAGIVLYRGEITTPSGGIPITQNATPVLTTATGVTED